MVGPAGIGVLGGAYREAAMAKSNSRCLEYSVLGPEFWSHSHSLSHAVYGSYQSPNDMANNIWPPATTIKVKVVSARGQSNGIPYSNCY